MNSSPDTASSKTCPVCGISFGCDPADCWCSKLPPVMPMLANASCYCPACLQAIIDAKLITVQ